MDAPEVSGRPLLTPPLNELRTALKMAARLQRRLALAYGIHVKKPKKR